MTAEAAAFDRMLEVRPAIVPGLAWPGHQAAAADLSGSSDFRAGLVAHELAMDARDAFFDERRQNDPAWRTV